MIFKIAIVFLVLLYTFWNTNATEIMIRILLVMLKMVHDQICILMIQPIFYCTLRIYIFVYFSNCRANQKVKGPKSIG